jgi:hypothetical protein
MSHLNTNDSLLEDEIYHDLDSVESDDTFKSLVHDDIDEHDVVKHCLEEDGRRDLNAGTDAPHHLYSVEPVPLWLQSPNELGQELPESTLIDRVKYLFLEDGSSKVAVDIVDVQVRSLNGTVPALCAAHIQCIRRPGTLLLTFSL